jgi:hypothetical protein
VRGVAGGDTFLLASLASTSDGATFLASNSNDDDSDTAGFFWAPKILALEIFLLAFVVDCIVLQGRAAAWIYTRGHGSRERKRSPRRGWDGDVHSRPMLASACDSAGGQRRGAAARGGGPRAGPGGARRGWRGGWRRWTTGALVSKDGRFWGGEGEADVVWWDPRVGKVNRGTAGANCVLRMKIFLLHPQ